MALNEEALQALKTELLDELVKEDPSKSQLAERLAEIRSADIGEVLEELIEEDEEEQKCSPIKPKKRTQMDSPFKKNFEDDSDNSNECCGAELDRGSPLDMNLNDLVREED